MMSMKKRMIAGLMSLLLLWGSAYAQTGKQAPAYPPSLPKPTLAEVRYGKSSISGKRRPTRRPRLSSAFTAAHG